MLIPPNANALACWTRGRRFAKEIPRRKEIGSMEFFDVMRKRFSVRAYQEKPVDEAAWKIGD
jgi:hypothetical protein